MPGPVQTGTSDELTFIRGVAAGTGIDPRVIKAQVVAEGAYASNGTGGHNYLNLRPAAGDVGVGTTSAGGFDQFTNVQDAIASTVARFHNPFAAGILAAAAAPGATPQTEISAIAASGWDAGHYGGPGGPHLLSDFEHLYGPAAAAGKATSTADTSGKSGLNVGAIVAPIPGVGPVVAAVDAVGGIGSTLDSIPKLIKFVTSWRFVEVVGGFFLLLVGLYLLGRQFGAAPSVPQVVTAAAAATPEGRLAAHADSHTPAVQEDLRPRPVYGKTRGRDTYGEVPY